MTAAAHALDPDRGQAIFGMGVDTVAHVRIERMWERHGERMAKAILLDDEWPDFVDAKRPEHFLAGRIAAKEAVAKAMGTGFSGGLWFTDIGVAEGARGPGIILSEQGLQRCSRFGVVGGQLSLSQLDERTFALAVLMK